MGALKSNEATKFLLQEIGVEAKDTLLVLNKVDHVQSISQLDAVLGRYPNAVPVSAKTRLGFERLHTVVSDALSRSFQDVDIEMSVANGKLLRKNIFDDIWTQPAAGDAGGALANNSTVKSRPNASNERVAKRESPRCSNMTIPSINRTCVCVLRAWSLLRTDCQWVHFV